MNTRKVDVSEFQVKNQGQSETPTSKTTNKRLLAGLTIYIRFLMYLKATYGQIHFLTPATKLRLFSIFADHRSSAETEQGKESGGPFLFYMNHNCNFLKFHKLEITGGIEIYILFICCTFVFR